MRCGLYGFLIIKPQTTLQHAVWCGTVHYYLRCGTVVSFCGQFWYGFCGLVNTPTFDITVHRGIDFPNLFQLMCLMDKVIFNL